MTVQLALWGVMMGAVLACLLATRRGRRATRADDGFLFTADSAQSSGQGPSDHQHSSHHGGFDGGHHGGGGFDGGGHH
jgi:surfactin synthase thioesterase subunit